MAETRLTVRNGIGGHPHPGFGSLHLFAVYIKGNGSSIVGQAVTTSGTRCGSSNNAGVANGPSYSDCAGTPQWCHAYFP